MTQQRECNSTSASPQEAASYDKPLLTKVSFLSLIPQAKLSYTASHLQVTLEAIE